MDCYFDNSATTQAYPEVAQIMSKILLEDYGNPSAQYSIGFIAKRYINESLKAVAKLINSEDDEIVFTSGGTEADNNALMYKTGDLCKLLPSGEIEYLERIENQVKIIFGKDAKTLKKYISQII